VPTSLSNMKAQRGYKIWEKRVWDEHLLWQQLVLFSLTNMWLLFCMLAWWMGLLNQAKPKSSFENYWTDQQTWRKFKWSGKLSVRGQKKLKIRAALRALPPTCHSRWIFTKSTFVTLIRYIQLLLILLIQHAALLKWKIIISELH